MCSREINEGSKKNQVLQQPDSFNLGATARDTLLGLETTGGLTCDSFFPQADLNLVVAFRNSSSVSSESFFFHSQGHVERK